MRELGLTNGFGSSSPTSSTCSAISRPAACAATACCGPSTCTSTRRCSTWHGAARSSPASAATRLSAARAGRRPVAVLRGTAAAADRATCRGSACCARRGPSGERSSLGAARNRSRGSRPRPPARSYAAGPRIRRESRAAPGSPSAPSGSARDPRRSRQSRSARGGCRHLGRPSPSGPRLPRCRRGGRGRRRLAGPEPRHAGPVRRRAPHAAARANEQGTLRRRLLGIAKPQLSPVRGRTSRPTRRWSIRRALTRTWAEPEPDAHSFLLLQAAWLDGEGDSLLDQRSVHKMPVHA